MKIEHLIETLKGHISLAEKSRWHTEQSNIYIEDSDEELSLKHEEMSNKYDDEMQEIESYLMDKLGIELDSYGTIQTLEKENA